jgi:ribulose 1,5-bisphosphate synthetase/thiazole synthase
VAGAEAVDINATGPAGAASAATSSPPSDSRTVDVAVVGGGLSGLAAARQLVWAKQSSWCWKPATGPGAGCRGSGGVPIR